MQHVINQFRQFFATVMSFASPPWSFDKIAIDAGALLGAIILYKVFRTNWAAELRAVPGRVRWAWMLQKENLGTGLAIGASGVLLGWYTWRHGVELHEISGSWQMILGVVSVSMVGTGGFYTFVALMALMFSPIGEDAPSAPGLDLVQRQQAYGDARAASAREVDAALRGGGGRRQQEFED